MCRCKKPIFVKVKNIMSENNKLQILIIYDYIFLEITNNFVHNIYFFSIKHKIK